jgi:hypothetical protein
MNKNETIEEHGGVKNKLFSYFYKRSNTMFKVIYDKYFRNENYEFIKENKFSTIKQNRIRFKEQLNRNIKWISNNDLKQICFEDIQDKILEEEIKYIKNNIKAFKAELLCSSLTFSLFLFMFATRIISKRIYNKNSFRIGIVFFACNLLFANTYFMTNLKSRNSRMEERLGIKFKKELEKYNMLFNNSYLTNFEL